MKVKQSKSFFTFLFDKNSSRKQIYAVLGNITPTDLRSINEVCYNLLENNYIRITPSLKNAIKKNKKILTKFTFSKSSLIQKRILKKYLRLFYYIIRKSQNFISLALSQ